MKFLLVAQLLIVALGEPLEALALHRTNAVVTLVGRGLVVVIVSVSGSIYAISLLVASLALAAPMLAPASIVSFQTASILLTISATCSWLALSLVIAQTVFGRGRVDSNRVVAAVVLYLNTAMIFMTLFDLLERLAPGSFAGLGDVANTDRRLATLLYFSVVTLTTTGYGDIAPIHPVARSMCNIEAIIGQLYPATVLARIISLEITALTTRPSEPSHASVLDRPVNEAERERMPPATQAARQPGTGPTRDRTEA